MSRLVLMTLAVLIPVSPVACGPQTPPPRDGSATAQADPAAELEWPREFERNGLVIRVYQPQVERWTDNQLEARAAVSVGRPGQANPTLGVVTLTAQTEVFKARGVATLDQIKVTSASFPMDPANEQTYRAAIDQSLPDVARDMSLDHLEANLATTAATEAAKAVPVRNAPPMILFATSPTLLVLVDGEPQLRPVEGQQQVMRVLNTRALILLDQASGTYFLGAAGHWYAAKAVGRPWAVATAVPPAFPPLRDELVKAGTVDAFLPDDPAAAPKSAPAVAVSTGPAELVQSTGDPQYTPIAGTNLLYVSNTDSAVFMLTQGQRYFVLISGRWFESATLQGPWTFVAGKDLPPDFARIPPESPKANVLVSVHGTPQARQAVIANTIPQTAAVKVAEAKVVVDYDGPPQFKTIEGAKNLEYATNAALPVILVEEPRSYWCVSKGVWFTSPASPLGPWAVATAVPPAIYTIPPSSPVHYVTYVRVYGTAPGVVYVGYTPGYMGTCVTAEGVVVYGTWYYYPPYVRTTVWYGYPPTYGYGAGFAYGATTGLAFGFAAGAMLGGSWGHPYWGPLWGYHGVDINASSVYRNWGGWVTRASGHLEWDRWDGGNFQRRGAWFNPYTGRASAGGAKGWVEGDGDFNAKRGGVTYNPRTGIVRGAGTHVQGDLDDGEFRRKSRGFAYNTRTNTGVARRGDDVYAGRDGNVYRHDRDIGWLHNATNGGWEDARRSGTYHQQAAHLNAQWQGRQIGQQRFNRIPHRTGLRGGGGGFRGRR